MLTKMVNMNNNNQLQQQQRENNAVSVSLYQAPPLPLKGPQSTRSSQQRALPSVPAEADSQSGPYKAVPAPKPLANPPPYRQPPPANSSSPLLPVARPHLHHNDSSSISSSSAAAAAAASSAASASESNPKSPGHGLLAYSSKFPIERELVVTTSEKIAEVGRIEKQLNAADNNTKNQSEPEAGSNMQAIVTQSAWGEDRRGINHGRHGEVIAGAPHTELHYQADSNGYDRTSGSEELHRPASYMPMHVHYTGWRQENNYVPMNFDGRIQHHPMHHQQQHQQQQQQHAIGSSNFAGTDHSLSFDSQHTGPSSLRDPFTPVVMNGNGHHLNQYEIQVDSAAADRPSTVTVAPWNNNHQASDTSTFDRLRDTCNKMFVRDGHLRGSSQFALSPTLPRAMEQLTIDPRSGGESNSTFNHNESSHINATAAIHQQQQQPTQEPLPKALDVSNNKSGSMRKKLSGKTYHHIKDMFTTKFNKSSKSKIATQENNSLSTGNNATDAATVSTISAMTAETSLTDAAATTPAMMQHQQVATSQTRQPDPVHSINQRIHSQLSGQTNSGQQIWGSYGRQSSKMEVSMNESDASALAKLTLSPSQVQPYGSTEPTFIPANSPYNLRHKPSVTFRMDLNNECQYSGGENPSAAAAVATAIGADGTRYNRISQGQVVLYDDTMHFPQHQGPQHKDLNQQTKNSLGEHDSSVSSIASAAVAMAGHGMKPRQVFTYGDYDVPAKSASLNSPNLVNEGGSSSGHQSAGSSSDLDKRSGQSVSTNDSGLCVLAEVSTQRNCRLSEQQNYLLDSSTETDVFVNRSTGNHQTSSDWADAADHEVNNVMEMRNYHHHHHQQQQQQQTARLQSSTPPLPPLSPESSPKPTPKLQHKFSNSKPDLLELAKGPSPMIQRVKPTTPAKPTCTSVAMQQRSSNDNTGKPNSFKRRDDEKPRATKSSFTSKTRGASKSTSSLHPLAALQEALDLGEITSTTTGLELDGDSDTSSSQGDDDLSTTMDMNESRTIRRQLEGLESMYSEVLKALQKKASRSGPSDYKMSKRRMYGSVSSLPSSVCSRPIYRDRRKNEERRRPKESKTTNKRFQRLESHVVTLARSVAHLSSEMRTQHIMIQEMETIRSEIAQLRTNPLRVGGCNTHLGYKLPRGYRVDRDTCWQGAVPALTDPTRIKKLTSFFGDEPPLLRIFLKKLGYEKYAPLFDQEKIGMIELPYLTEEKMKNMGLPMGPRIRIMQEAQLCIRSDNISDYGMV